MFKIRIFVPENFFFFSDRGGGVTQGNIFFRILSNIYLHELDKFMKKIMTKDRKVTSFTPNEEYNKLLNLSKYERTLDSILQQNIRRYHQKKLFN